MTHLRPNLHNKASSPNGWVRHARVQAPVGLCYGRLNVPADQHHTRQVAECLAATLPAGVLLKCSPLQRCELLAQYLIALRPDLMLQIDPQIQEMDFGRWEGRPWSEVPQNELQAWTEDFADYVCGQAESVRQFIKRVESACWASLEQGASAQVWITHAGVIRAAQRIWSGQGVPLRAAEWSNQPIDFGQCIYWSPIPGFDGFQA